MLTAAHVAQAAGADVIAASVAAAGRDNVSRDDDGQTVTLRLRRDLKLEKVVGLQTDKPLKRAFMPYGGIKMAQEAGPPRGRLPPRRAPG